MKCENCKRKNTRRLVSAYVDYRALRGNKEHIVTVWWCPDCGWAHRTQSLTDKDGNNPRRVVKTYTPKRVCRATPTWHILKTGECLTAGDEVWVEAWQAWRPVVAQFYGMPIPNDDPPVRRLI